MTDNSDIDIENDDWGSDSVLAGSSDQQSLVTKFSNSIVNIIKQMLITQLLNKFLHYIKVWLKNNEWNDFSKGINNSQLQTMNYSTKEKCEPDCKFLAVMLTDNIKNTVSNNRAAEKDFNSFIFKQNNWKLCYYIFQSLSRIKVFTFKTFIFNKLNIMNFADSD